MTESPPRRREGIRLGLATIATAAWDGPDLVTGHFTEVVLTGADGTPRWRRSAAAPVVGVAAEPGAIAAGTLAGRVEVLDPDGALRWTAEHGGPVCLDLRHGRLAVTRGTDVVVRDAASGDEVARFAASSAPRRVRWTPDGRLLLACTDGAVLLHDAGSGELVWRHQLAAGPAWDAAACGERVAVAGRSLVLLEGGQAQEASLASAGWAVAWSPDGRELVVGTERGRVRRFDRDGQGGEPVDGAAGPILDVAWDDRGIRWANASATSGGLAGGPVRRVAALAERIVAVTDGGVAAFDRAGARLVGATTSEPVRGASIDRDGAIVHTAHRVCSPGRFERPLTVALPLAMAHGPGDRLATAHLRSSLADGRTLEVRVVDASTGQLAGPRIVERTNLEVEQLCFGPDGAWLAARAGSRIVVWSMADGQRSAVLDGVQPTERGLVRVGDRIASAMREGGVRLWSVDAPGQPRMLETGDVTALAVDPEGRLLAVGIRGHEHAAVQTWDARSGGKVCAALPDVGGPVVAVACAGHRIAAIVREGPTVAVVVWDGLFGETIARGTSPAPWSALALSDDAERLVAGSTDGDLHAWSLSGLSASEPAILDLPPHA